MEQLRATLHSDLQEKNDILDKLTSERGESRECLFNSCSLPKVEGIGRSPGGGLGG